MTVRVHLTLNSWDEPHTPWYIPVKTDNVTYTTWYPLIRNRIPRFLRGYLTCLSMTKRVGFQLSTIPSPDLPTNLRRQAPWVPLLTFITHSSRGSWFYMSKSVSLTDPFVDLGISYFFSSHPFIGRVLTVSLFFFFFFLLGVGSLNHLLTRWDESFSEKRVSSDVGWLFL